MTRIHANQEKAHISAPEMTGSGALLPSKNHTHDQNGNQRAEAAKMLGTFDHQACDIHKPQIGTNKPLIKDSFRFRVAGVAKPTRSETDLSAIMSAFSDWPGHLSAVESTTVQLQRL